MAIKMSWREKLADSKDLPRIQKIDDTMSKRWGTGTFVIAKPVEVDEIMRKVRKGKLITINEIRQVLAKKYKTDIACPITTGIFAWIAANAAGEWEAEGRKRIPPTGVPSRPAGSSTRSTPAGSRT